MKRYYESPTVEIEKFILQDDLLNQPSRIPDDGEIDDDDLFA